MSDKEFSRTVLRDAVGLAQSQGARISTWLIVGNGAGLVFTFNAAVNGTTCPLSLVRTALASFVLGLVAAYVGVVCSHVHVQRNIRRFAGAARTREWSHAFSYAAYALLGLSAAAFVWALSSPLLAPAGTLEACSAQKRLGLLPAAAQTATQNVAGTEAVNQTVNRAGTNQLSH